MLIEPDRILELIKDDTSCVSDDVGLFAVDYLQRSVLKKLQTRETGLEQNRVALASFEKRASNQWNGENFLFCSPRTRDLYSIFEYEVNRFFSTPDGNSIFHSWDYVHHHGRMGPKASVGSASNTLYGKLFASKLTASNESLRFIHQRIVNRDPRWAVAEATREHLFGSDDNSSSKVSFVPKNVDTSRTIATEPALNMFFQLGLGEILASRLQEYGIDIYGDDGWEKLPPIQQELWKYAPVKLPWYRESQPEINFRLARQASVDGHLATIDLSHASDSISAVLVRDIVPRHSLPYLELARTPTVELPDGRLLGLDLFSTMGNGFNFPLQTAIFLCAIRAVYIQNNRWINSHGPLGINLAVFGDDIVCCSDLYDHVEGFLSFLGFTVNSAKSFHKGSFRESCGGDFYKGHPVRPFFIKRADTVQDLYLAANQLNDWTAQTGIPLPGLWSYLVERIMWFDVDVFVVPPFSDDTAGLRLPSSLVDKSVYRSKYGRWKWSHYEACTHEVKVEHLMQSRKVRFPINIEGLYLAFLDGKVVDGSMTWRKPPKSPRYTRRTAVGPVWDTLRGRSRQSDFLRWEGAVQSNARR